MNKYGIDMKNKLHKEKELTPTSIAKAKLLISIWNQHDKRDFEALEHSVNRILALSGANNSDECAKFIAHAYKIHGNWDDVFERTVKIKLFGRLDLIWSSIENELKEALKKLDLNCYTKSAYHHTCWWMYYSALNLLKKHEIITAPKRYLYYFLTLWHIFCDQYLKTKSCIAAIRCTYFLLKGAKYGHTHKQYDLAIECLAKYWYVSKKYNHPVYMF